MIIYFICTAFCGIILFSLWCMLKVSKMADEYIFIDKEK